MSAESQLRLLSLNCWGLKFVSKNRSERISAIVDSIARSSHDIIALQEIWVYADYEKVAAAVQHRLPHAKFFYSGALGAGLAIFSRFAFVETSIHPYALNGAPIDIAGGDWFVGKAAASVVIIHPLLGKVQIFNTHLYAKGGEDGPEYRRAHRLVNAWEYAKLARQAAELGRYVIGLGDFNSIPITLPMTIIRDHAALHDSWAVVHPDNDSIAALSPRDAIVKHGITADSPINTWSAGKPHLTTTFWGKRLDYILYRQPRGQAYPQLRASECNVVLTERAPGHKFSYSDHFGLEATLDIVLGPDQAEASSTYHSGTTDDTQTELSKGTVMSVIKALTDCYRFSLERSKRELFVFTLCLALLVGVAIGTAWLPHSWINPIFIIFTVVVAWAGTTMLYEGFLYGNWERNALMNVIEELEIYQKGLDIQAGRRSPT
ncbi:inositol phosphophingolipids phospholipase C [Macrolepiota fuliginosa MF-IS2]|uniref:Inositol phosphophingolipids phospholipase C n=1 Tax=Macrolepiota fuliginosa MF-IS2 TaxID=1400762 RepID=A0A9P6C9P8_9AGAR|nr:inositol phosphophingolipids phospholipase C [Macrolepiota fuliginosa MF-IS2]